MKFGLRCLTQSSSPLTKLFTRVRCKKTDAGERREKEGGTSLDSGEVPLAKERNGMSNSTFGLEDIQVREIMVPRVDIATIDEDASISDAVDIIVKQGHNRILIYEDTIDNVRGVIHARDLLRVMHKGGHVGNLKKIARPAYFVPESKKAGELLQEFREKGTHLAVVVDEYGGTEGLVTVRDILDEIVKELEDEYDDDESRINASRPSEAIMDATVTIDELNEMFGVDIKENGFDTVGGLVFTQLGRIPTVGDKIEVGQIGVSVLSTLGKRIKRVKVNKI